MADPTNTPPPKAGPTTGDVLTATLDEFKRLATVVSLILAWQNRRERGQVLPLAVELGLIPYEAPPADASDEVKDKHTASVNEINAVLAAVPTAIPR